jgi:hypothetical protein
MLAQDPLRDLIDAIDGLGPEEGAGLRETLSHLSAALAGRRAAPAFGTCRDCRHFTPGAESGYCACLAAELAAEELDKLCASYLGPAHDMEPEGDRNGRA